MSASGKLQSNNPSTQNTYEDHLKPIKDLVGFINDDFRRQTVDETLSDLRGLWEKCIEAAIVIPADNPGRDALFNEMGDLGRSGSLRTHSTPKYGELWARYPLLAKVVLEATIEATKDIEKERWLNLATFAARLVALTALDDAELLQCALVMLRETLETQRRLNVEEHGTEAPLSDLLPAAVAWFKVAGCKLVDIVMEKRTGRAKRDEEEEMLIVVGGLAAQERRIPKLGFSLRRWHFWEQRLEELRLADDKEISDQALEGKNAMIEAWERSAI